MEVWKDIPEFEGQYQVSTLGRVRSLDRVLIQKNGTGRPVKGKVMKHFIDDSGYPRIALNASNKFKVHRLVALAFIPNPENKPCVNHLDFDRTNPSVHNLEWATVKENHHHSRNAGRIKNPSGFNCSSSKAVIAIEIATGNRKTFGSQKLAAKELGLHQTHVNGVITGRDKSTGGYKFISA